MRLDPDLVRELLLTVEREHQAIDWEMPICSSEDFARYYAAKKLIEAGLLSGNIVPDTDDEEIEWVLIREMTANGHAFLETVRDSKAWAAGKAFASKIGSFSLDVLASGAKAYISAELQKHTGMTI